MRCTESFASLETQFGDEGHGINRAPLSPSVLGRLPAHENNGIQRKNEPKTRSAVALTSCFRKSR